MSKVSQIGLTIVNLQIKISLILKYRVTNNLFIHTMIFFLDTANLKQIQKFKEKGIISGVTTNPSLIAKEGIKSIEIQNHVVNICNIIDGPVSVEVYSTQYDNILEEARRYIAWNRKVVVKIPCIEEGLKACKTLSKEGIKTNITLIFTPLQALLAAKAGATYVSPFIGRLEDAGQDGILLISEIKKIFENYKLDTKILSASFRNVKQIKEVALIGSDIATVSPELMGKVIYNIFTQKGLEEFLKAIK